MILPALRMTDLAMLTTEQSPAQHMSLTRRLLLSVQARGGGYALEFNGNDYINIDDAADDFNDSFTVCAWINTDSNSGRQTIVGRNTNTGGNRFIFAVLSGKLSLYINGADFNSGINVANGAWHYVLFSHNIINDKITLYIDGSEVKSSSDSAFFSSDDKLSIGQEWDSGSPSDFFNGIIDEVRIYEQALTLGQIQQLYAESAPAHGIPLSP